MQQAASSLEKTVLRLIKEQGIKLPIEIHKVVSKDGELIAEADLYYEPKIGVFIDGPDHDKEHVKLDDDSKRTKLKKLGYKIVVVHHADIPKGIELLKTSLAN